MRILLLSSAYNSLTQNAHVELVARQHEVGIATATQADAMREAVDRFLPDLILCPMLAQVIPSDIWQTWPCLILHPGIVGDRGPASLDWAILNGETEWGTTVVEAAAEMDAGAIWATVNFPMRNASKSSLYRDEVARAAMQAMLSAVERFEGGQFVPEPLDYSKPNVRGICRPPVKAEQRRIHWQTDTTAAIIRKIRSADGSPGVLDELFGVPMYLYGAHREGRLTGKPGEIIACRHGAICRATIDGAVWISHLKRKGSKEDGYFKLPACQVLGDAIKHVPVIGLPLTRSSPTQTFRDIWYEESGTVGYVHFDFYNGAMGTDHCRRLREAVLYARQRPTRVIVLCGGRDFWSNGIHLNLIEAAPDPAQESWENINAMDDLVLAILEATDHLTIAAMYGSAGAGGVMLALAADKVLARDGIVLNPHYKGMGGLYGSEYWTYSLPKRVGTEMAMNMTEQCRPISIHQAKRIGMIDHIIEIDNQASSRFDDFRSQVAILAECIAADPWFQLKLDGKRTGRERDESIKPLEAYRVAELMEMRENFWGEDRSYHQARAAFVRKQPRPRHLKCYVALDANGQPGVRPTARSNENRDNTLDFQSWRKSKTLTAGLATGSRKDRLSVPSEAS